MLTLRYARRSRFLLSPGPPSATGILLSTVAGAPQSLVATFISNTAGSQSPTRIHNDLVNYLGEWFSSRDKKPLLYKIHEILRTQEGSSLDSSLSKLNLYVTEKLVVDVLRYSNRDILAFLKFFDWAGRQKGFYHTQGTFHAIFRILCSAQMTELMHEFLVNYAEGRYMGNVTYQSVLVIGYALSGKCEAALNILGKMRFGGSDMDGFGYHVLLDSLVDQGFFDMAETFVKEIKVRGYESHITHSIVVKSLARQKQFDKAEEYVRWVLSVDGVANKCGLAVAFLVGALCKDNHYKRAALLAVEIREMGVVLMDDSYSTWIKELLNAGKVDGALKFLKDKMAIEGYVPDVHRYNMLALNLLKRNRFHEVFDLLVDMKDKGVLPDEATWNSILCLLCKAGRIDIAMDLYNSREDFGLSVNSPAYNYLINTLLEDARTDDAYHMLRKCIEQGDIPWESSFLIIADALCREGKPAKMRELVFFALERNIMPTNLTFDRLIENLCMIGRVDDGYWVYNLVNRLNKSVRVWTYSTLIREFSNSGRVEIASRLLVEMLEKGYNPLSKLVKEVIYCICKMDNPRDMLIRVLEMAIPGVSTSDIYEYLIYGAGRAMKPELARQVYDMMETSGVKQTWRHDRLLLLSVLRSNNIAQGRRLFHDLLNRSDRNKKMWDIMIVSLCKATEPELAASMMRRMKSQNLRPSIKCYEELIKLYCVLDQFHNAVDLVNDMAMISLPVSSFIGNTFLLHSLRSPKLYSDWVTYVNYTNEIPDACLKVGHLAGAFSGHLDGTCDDDEDIEKLIHQCFPMDHFTVNLLVRRAGFHGLDYACEYFHSLCEKGFEPNRRSYDYIVYSLAKNGRTTEARKWIAEMHANGYNISCYLEAAR